MREPAADLAIAVAIVSGYYSIPVPRDMVVIGEVRLAHGSFAICSCATGESRGCYPCPHICPCFQDIPRPSLCFPINEVAALLLLFIANMSISYHVQTSQHTPNDVTIIKQARCQFS